MALLACEQEGAHPNSADRSRQLPHAAVICGKAAQLMARAAVRRHALGLLHLWPDTCTV